MSVSGFEKHNEIGIIAQDFDDSFCEFKDGTTYFHYNRLYNLQLLETKNLRKRVKSLEDNMALLLEKFKNLK